MNAIGISLFQGLLVMLLAPIATGLVRKFKAFLQGRIGAPIFLPYIRIATLLRKEMVISRSTSWIFRWAPFMVVGTTIFLAVTLPLLTQVHLPGGLSHFIVIAGVLMLGSVFLVLAGLDSGSAFGGMGSSREMTIVALLEPTIITAFATFAIVSGSSDVQNMLEVAGSALAKHPVLILSIVSIVCIALAENARYPVDNPSTHLELTMVHEAMILEYSGPFLALVEYAASLKLTIFALLAANFVMPSPLLTANADIGMVPIVLGATLLKIIVAMFLLALLETSIPKMRFYRMQEYTTWSFLAAFAAFATTLLFKL